MKKLFAIIALIFILAGPVFAASVVGETFLTSAVKGAAYGAAAGGAAGALGAGIGAIPGAIFGAVAGFIGGGIVGAVKQNAEDDQTSTENTGTINQLALQNESIEAANETKVQQIEAIEAEIEPQRVALAKWQDTYDASVALQQDTAQQNIKALKENWGIYNATLASQSREGATARLLSQEQKGRVVAYAGEDMQLNTDSIIEGIKSVYEDETNFDEKGNLTQQGAEKLALSGSNYGIYDKQMSQLAVDLVQQKKQTQTAITQMQGNIGTLEKEINLNEQAMDLNASSIEALKKNNVKLAQRRWGSSN